MIAALLAQQEHFMGGLLKGLGPLGENEFVGKSGAAAAANLFAQVASILVGFLTTVAGIWFVVQFLIGAFGWLTAGADKAAVENAQKRITRAVIGLVLVVAAVFIIELIGKIFGVEILNPAKFIIGIWS